MGGRLDVHLGEACLTLMICHSLVSWADGGMGRCAPIEVVPPQSAQLTSNKFIHL